MNELSYKLAPQHATIAVLHDDSQLAHEVLAQLSVLSQLELVTSLLNDDIASIASTSASLVLLIQADATPLPTAVVALLQEQPQAIGVSQQLVTLDYLSAYVQEQVLWPWSKHLLFNRIEQLSQLYQTHQKIDGLRQALAWHKARVDREHQLVEHIFKNALSRNYLNYQYVNTYLTPVSKFNGDLCLISPGPLGNIYMLMADFTGHGLAPATGALPLSQAFFAMADRGVSVAEMVTEFNYRMSRLLPNDMFCAAILLELSANGERVNYWNGGMPAALLINEKGDVLRHLKPTHVALGVLDDEEFDSRVTSFRAPKGSSIAMFTDGVIELLGHQHKFLGADALEILLSTYPKPEDFPQIVKELERFRGETPLHDDLSLAILCCRPTELGQTKTEYEHYGLPFRLESVLQAEQLKQLDPVALILSAISQLPHLRHHRTTIYLFLAEAFNNALEHGLLGLDSKLKQDADGFLAYYQQRYERLQQLREGEIRISLEFEPTRKEVTIRVADTGEGTLQHDGCDDFSENAYGRGLELLRQMTTDLTWDNETRTVSFKYRL